jgi:hypothetical protein
MAAGVNAWSATTSPTPVVTTYMPSARPRSTTLVSPATTCTPHLPGGGGQGIELSVEHGQRKSLLEHEGDGQHDRPRAARRQVVHRAVHGQGADRPPGEGERPHHVGVGGDGQATRSAP